MYEQSLRGKQDGRYVIVIPESVTSHTTSCRIGYVGNGMASVTFAIYNEAIINDYESSLAQDMKFISIHQNIIENMFFASWYLSSGYHDSFGRE